LIEKLEMSTLPGISPDEKLSCICLEVPLPFDHYQEVKFIGIDETEGRFGEVTLKQCRHCRRYWLHYLVEYEAFKGSGRYFMGLIALEVANALTPEKAVAYLESLEWRLFGGSYFGRKGRSTASKINVV
jgi:hypothetical protein